MASFRDYLALTRAHTAPATFILLIAGYYAGGGRDPSTIGLLFVAGVLAHTSSFGHNVVMDHEYDARDPGKAHHPLTSGRIPFPRAVRFVTILQSLAAVPLFFLAWGNAHALAALAVFVLAGHSYNDHYAKHSLLGFLPISIAWTALAVFAMTIAGTVNWWFAAYMFLVILYQIDVEGRLKDLTTNEPSLMKKLGAKFITYTYKPGTYYEPGWSSMYAYVLQIAALFIVIHIGVGTLWSAASTAIVLLTSVVAYTHIRLTHPRRYNRATDLRHMGVHEVAAVYIGMFLVMPFLEAVVLGVIGLSWFMGLNGVLWGTVFAPRV